MKNPHAVALGRLGGAKGGAARARALTPARRRAIARQAGMARTRALSAAERTAIATRAARTRWAAPIRTADEGPVVVRRLLKSYDPKELRWFRSNERYVIVREILVRGDEGARRWLDDVLGRTQIRALVTRFRGAGCSEPERQRLRNDLGLTFENMPVRSFIGFRRRPVPEASGRRSRKATGRPPSG